MASRNPPPGKVKMTINIDPDLKRRLKQAAAKRDTFVQDIVIAAIEKELARS